MDFLPPFGAWLKKRRKSLGLTQAELAKRAHFSTASIRKLEEGERISSRALAEALVEPLGISADARDSFIAFARGLADHQPLSAPPIPLTPLLGREADLAAIKRVLSHADARFVTLIGPPGVGKTRLALQIAHDLRPSFTGGAAFVALAPLSDPLLIPAAIAEALQNRALGSGASVDALARFIESRQLLLVLDNFEHLLEGASVISTLLMRCPGLRVLVTSRAILNLSAERVIELKPLANASAIELFARRASAAKPAFALTPENTPVVAAICRHLDGLPLAIELAAARARILTPQKLLERLTDHAGASLDLLTSGPRDWPERQRTLRATIEWSYALLDPNEQRFFRRLGVFASGSGLEMIQAVCGEDAAGAETLLQSLLDKSLIHETIGFDGAPRFDLLQTLREYARVKLEESGDGLASRRRMTVYLNDLSDRAHPYVVGPDKFDWSKRLAAERDNIWAALAWARGSGGDYALGLRLAGRIGFVVTRRWHWNMHLALADYGVWLEDIETRILELAPEDQAVTLFGICDLAQMICGADAARRIIPLMEDAVQRNGDRAGQRLRLRLQAFRDVLVDREYPRAIQRYEELLAVAGEDPLWRACALSRLARTLALHGQPDRALALLSEAIPIWEAHGILFSDNSGLAAAHEYLAVAHLARGEFAQAHAAAELAAEEFARANWWLGEATTARIAGFAALAEGRPDAFCVGVARLLRVVPAMLIRAQVLFANQRLIDEVRVVLDCAQYALARRRADLPSHVWPLMLMMLGRAYISLANPSIAARLFAAAHGQRELAAGLPPDSPFRTLTEPQVEEARAAWATDPALGPHWEVGARMSFDGVAAYVLALDLARDAAPAGE